MKIISIEKHLNMYVINLEDGREIKILEEDYYKHSLYDAEDISEELIYELNYTRIFNKAKSDALRSISNKKCTSKEMIQKLCNKNYHSDVAEKVVEELVTLGYINDRMYTEKFIKDRNLFKAKSQKMIAYELLNKGIESEIIEDYVEKFCDSDYDVAYKLAIKRFGDKDLNDEKLRRRFISFFKTRGFDSNLIIKLIDKLKFNRNEE